jgi:predicted enzyme related to lactoylglutathione lyase
MRKLFLTLLTAGALFAEAPAPQLHVSMISLGVTDTARSIKFYGETLGLQLVSEPEPGEVALFQAGALTIVLNHPAGHAPEGRLAGAVEVIFQADSVTGMYNKLLERGCHFIGKPLEVTSGTWAATFTDPDGHRLTILGPR